MTNPLILPGQIISKQFFLPNLTGATSYPLDGYAAFGYKIVAVNGLKTTSGSVKITFKIGSTAVYDLNGVTVNASSPNIAVTTAGSTNVVVPGNTLSVSFDTASSPQNIQFTLVAVRTDSESGFINKFRNPGMNVAQRGVGPITVSSGNTSYILDGWMVASNGGTMSCGQAGNITLPSGGQADNAIYLNGTGMTSFSLIQRIESSTAALFAGQMVTVQITIDNFTASSITPEITCAYPTSAVADKWTSGATVDSNCNGASVQACASSGVTTVAYSFVANGSAIYGYQVAFTFIISGTFSGLYATTADIRVTPDVASGVNYNPPIPEIRPIAIELPHCQRYFNSTFGNGVTPGTSTHVGMQSIGSTTSGSNYVGSSTNFPVQMMQPYSGPPTITYYDGAGNSSKLSYYNGSSWTDNATPTAGSIAFNVGRTGFMNVVQATSTTAAWFVHYTASAEL